MSISEEVAPPADSRPRRRLLLAASIVIVAAASAVAVAARGRGGAAPSLPRIATHGGASIGFVLTMAFAPDSRTLASGGERLMLHDLGGGTARRLTRDDGGKAVPWTDGDTADDRMRTLALAFAPDGRTLASGDHHGTIRIWDLESGRILTELTGHSGRVHVLDFSADGRSLASAADDRLFRLWDVETGEQRLAYESPQGNVIPFVPRLGRALVGFQPGDRTLATADFRGATTLGLWDAETGEGRVVRGEMLSLWPFQYAPDARRLLAADPEGLALWDTQDGRRQLLIRGPHPESYGGSGSAFAPDGRVVGLTWVSPVKPWLAERSRLVGAGLDLVGASRRLRNDVAVHESDTGRLLAMLPDQVSCTFAPDGATLATTDGQGLITLWDARPVITGATTSP